MIEYKLGYKYQFVYSDGQTIIGEFRGCNPPSFLVYEGGKICRKTLDELIQNVKVIRWVKE